MKRNHHGYSRTFLGESDSASLIMRGNNEHEQIADLLRFGSDGGYKAYIVDSECEIPEYYKLVFISHNYLEIYDDIDKNKFKKFKGDIIKVYRSGEYGCIIQILDKE